MSNVYPFYVGSRDREDWVWSQPKQKVNVTSIRTNKLGMVVQIYNPRYRRCK
jgi:hypothetical protein